jgi:DNA topoisomerase-1
LPGQALFQYQEAGEVQQVTSGDVNDYLQAHLGGPFTAKDFRTWGATVFAFRQLALQEPPDTGDAALANRIRQEVLRDTAAILGNTPRICEKCYVDPRIFDGFEDGRVRKAAGNAKGPRQWELAAIRYLKRMRKSG